MERKSIWLYNDIDTDNDALSQVLVKLTMPAFCCPYCVRADPTIKPMQIFEFENDEYSWYGDDQFGRVAFCNDCGYWASGIEHVSSACTYYTNFPGSKFPSISEKEKEPNRYSAAMGRVKLFHFNQEMRSDFQQLQQELSKYGKRVSIDPYRLEHVVAAMLKDMGRSVRVTSKSKDNGVDVIVFDGPDSELGAVQVKRYNNKIRAELIDTLAGVLVRRGVTHGVFVTTSDFQSGAYKRVLQLEDRGFHIELINGKRLLEAIDCSTSPCLSKDQIINGLRYDKMTWLEWPV